MKLFTFTWPLRLLALIVSAGFIFVVNFWIYRSLIEISNFLGLGFNLNYNLLQALSFIVSIISISATVAPLLWSRFTQYGNNIDKSLQKSFSKIVARMPRSRIRETYARYWSRTSK